MTRWIGAVCIAVVGPRSADAENLLRLHDDKDMVRYELVAALASSDLTLVEGASLPDARDPPRTTVTTGNRTKYADFSRVLPASRLFSLAEIGLLGTSRLLARIASSTHPWARMPSIATKPRMACTTSASSG